MEQTAMDKPTHVELFSCFTAGWGLFMLTEVRAPCDRLCSCSC